MDAFRVGHSAQHYPEQGSIIGQVPNIEYEFCREYYSLASHLLSLVGISPSSKYRIGLFALSNSAFDFQAQFLDLFLISRTALGNGSYDV